MVEDLSFLNKDEIGDYKKLEDKVLIANRRNTYEETDFLDPFWQKMLQSIVNSYNDMSVSFFGAYNNAERKVCVIYNSYLPEPLEDDFISVLAFDYKTDDIKHKDVLGKILSLGIERYTVGDIYFYNSTCYIAVKKSVEAFLFTEFRDIKRHSIELYTPENILFKNVSADLEEETLIAASLRSDLIVSKIYNIKRNIASNMILKGLFKLDYRVFLRNDKPITVPSLISLRGYGRVHVDEIVGKTGKDNLRIKIRREEH